MSNATKKPWASVPRFPLAAYQIDCPWDRLARYVAQEQKLGLLVVPDYQRGHVWEQHQRRAWVEHCLMGGETGREVTLVCERMDGAVPAGRYAVADGLQRLTTAMMFAAGELRVFSDAARPDGYAVGDFDGPLNPVRHSLKVVTVVAPTRADELLLYLRINASGTPHSPAELDRVRGLLRAELAAGGAVTLCRGWIEFLVREADVVTAAPLV